MGSALLLSFRWGSGLHLYVERRVCRLRGSGTHRRTALASWGPRPGQSLTGSLAKVRVSDGGSGGGVQRRHILALVRRVSEDLTGGEHFARQPGRAIGL
jgi:hypothetical protein